MSAVQWVQVRSDMSAVQWVQVSSGICQLTNEYRLDLACQLSSGYRLDLANFSHGCVQIRCGMYMLDLVGNSSQVSAS